MNKEEFINEVDETDRDEINATMASTMEWQDRAFGFIEEMKEHLDNINMLISCIVYEYTYMPVVASLDKGISAKNVKYMEEVQEHIDHTFDILENATNRYNNRDKEQYSLHKINPN